MFLINFYLTNLLQLQDDQTVPSGTETGTLDESVGSQNEDMSLMQQLHDALEEDRMIDMKRMMDKMEPDVRSDEVGSNLNDQF
jgi:hypothetical protein